MVKVITAANFEAEVKNAPGKVLVDFWADWCGPCKMLSPVVEQLSEEYAGKVSFGKVNVDEEPGLAGMFRITSIPTLIVFKDGQPVETSIGVVPKEAIAAILDR